MTRNLRAGVVLLAAGAVMVFVTTRDRGTHPTAGASRAAAVFAAAGSPVGWEQPARPAVGGERRQLLDGVEVTFTGDAGRFTNADVAFTSPPVGPAGYDAVCHAAVAYLDRMSDLLTGAALGARFGLGASGCVARMQGAGRDRIVGRQSLWTEVLTTATTARYLAGASIENEGLGGPHLSIGVGYTP